MSKPREFWIWRQNQDFDLGFERAMVAEYPQKDTLDGSIHVIEKKAFDDLMSHAKALYIDLDLETGATKSKDDFDELLKELEK